MADDDEDDEVVAAAAAALPAPPRSAFKNAAIAVAGAPLFTAVSLIKSSSRRLATRATASVSSSSSTKGGHVPRPSLSAAMSASRPRYRILMPRACRKRVRPSPSTALGMGSRRSSLKADGMTYVERYEPSRRTAVSSEDWRGAFPRETSREKRVKTFTLNLKGMRFTTPPLVPLPLLPLVVTSPALAAAAASITTTDVAGTGRAVPSAATSTSVVVVVHSTPAAAENSAPSCVPTNA